MGVLQRFEQRLEGLVQGAFAKAFGGWVEPVEVAAALRREAEDKKAIVAAGRVLVPNVYTVELGASDAERLKEYDEPLRAELAQMVSEAAREQGWSFVGPVEVRFEETAALDTGTFRVRSAAVAGDLPAAATRPGPSPHLVAAQAKSSVEHRGRRVPLSGVTTIGRGAEADLQIVDTGVSRLHAELRVVAEARGERVEVHDLGSTNGTRVNGQRITAATLTDGDRISVGTSELVFRTGR
ncbi:MAG: domain containing protein [Frankiales bacterium]|nr:domain containing protein [Frankiales bacterium]